jgi:hypothetical protein
MLCKLIQSAQASDCLTYIRDTKEIQRSPLTRDVCISALLLDDCIFPGHVNSSHSRLSAIHHTLVSVSWRIRLSCFMNITMRNYTSSIIMLAVTATFIRQSSASCAAPHNHLPHIPFDASHLLSQEAHGKQCSLPMLRHAVHRYAAHLHFLSAISRSERHERAKYHQLWLSRIQDCRACTRKRLSKRSRSRAARVGVTCLCRSDSAHKRFNTSSFWLAAQPIGDWKGGGESNLFPQRRNRQGTASIARPKNGRLLQHEKYKFKKCRIRYSNESLPGTVPPATVKPQQSSFSITGSLNKSSRLVRTYSHTRMHGTRMLQHKLIFF